MTFPPSHPADQRSYWNAIAETYQQQTTISVDDFHYGPLLPGDRDMQLIPLKLDGRRALELGCGGAQNSIYLASRGAICTAVDIADAQIAAAEKLAKQCRVNLDLRTSALEDIDAADLGVFDLVHSVFALPFVSDPAAVIRNAAACLAEEGTFILSTVHPLYPCEWLELDSDGFGLFVLDYFTPPVELEQGGDQAIVTSHAYPVSTVCEWLHDAGLVIARLLEPLPLPVDKMSVQEIHERVPYYSPGWHGLCEKLTHIPVALVLQCRHATSS